jgi:hypothetical protein
MRADEHRRADFRDDTTESRGRCGRNAPAPPMTVSIPFRGSPNEQTSSGQDRRLRDKESLAGTDPSRSGRDMPGEARLP